MLGCWADGNERNGELNPRNLHQDTLPCDVRVAKTTNRYTEIPLMLMSPLTRLAL